MDAVSLPQQNLDGLDWRARNQLKFRNKVGSRFVPATSNPLLERLMAMTSPERRQPSPENTHPSRVLPSSSRPVKSPAPRKTPKASSKPKAAATISKPTALKRKRAVNEDSESDDPLSGPHPKMPKRMNKISGLSSKGSTRTPAAVVERRNGVLNSGTANALQTRLATEKGAPKLSRKQTRSGRDQNASAGIIEKDGKFDKKTNANPLPELKPGAPGTEAHPISDDNEAQSPLTKSQVKTKGSSAKVMSKCKALSKKSNDKAVIGQEPPDIDPILDGTGLELHEDRGHGSVARKSASTFEERAITPTTTSHKSSTASRKPSALVNSDSDVFVAHPSKKGTKNSASKTSKIPRAATHNSNSASDSDNAPLAPAPSISKIRQKADPATKFRPPVSPSLNPKARTLSVVPTKFKGSKGATNKKPKVPLIPDSEDDSDDEALIIPIPKKLKAPMAGQGVLSPTRPPITSQYDLVMRTQASSRKVPPNRTKILTKEHTTNPEDKAEKKIIGARLRTSKRAINISSHERSPSPPAPKLKSSRTNISGRKRKAVTLDGTDVESDEEHSLSARSSSATLVQQNINTEEKPTCSSTKPRQICKRLSLVEIEAEVDEEAETLNKKVDEVSFALQAPADEKTSEVGRSLRSASVKTSSKARGPIQQSGQKSITTEVDNNTSLGPSKTIGPKTVGSRSGFSNTPVGSAASASSNPKSESSRAKQSSQMTSRPGVTKASSINVAAKAAISRRKGSTSSWQGGSDLSPSTRPVRWTRWIYLPAESPTIPITRLNLTSCGYPSLTSRPHPIYKNTSILMISSTITLHDHHIFASSTSA